MWDGAHPCWDAFTGLCVYIKSSSNQIKSSVTYDPKSSFYDTSPEQRQHINSKKMRTNRPHDVAHASVPVIPSRERVDAAPVCSSSRTRDGTASPASPPPFGGEEAGGAREGWRGGLRGLGPPWEKKVGFDALARGFACCLHITSKGEPPAYCLSLCRRSSGHGMLHISHMQRQRVLAQLRMYCWCLLLARD